MSTVLELRSVSWAPPAAPRPVVEDLSLAVASGEAVVLCAGLGSGKSSVLRLAVGLEEPERGTVRVCGQPPAAVRDRIGYVPAEGALIANLSLWDNLVLPLRWWRDPPPDEVQRRAQAALAPFGIERLPPLLPAFAPTHLRRIVALARAVILDPALVVLDEPAADLDPESAAEVWALLLDWAERQGRAVLAACAAPPPLPGLRRIALAERPAPLTRSFRARRPNASSPPATA